MSEIWELLDINRQKTGILHERGVTVPDGLYHLVVEIWVQKPNDELIPELWDRYCKYIKVG
ncbi:hypothetical protein MACA111363_01705 [Macrococcoides canis]|uniref:Uncharacterized protein n=1 Tax=Macrococcoides canis TaxID=1855823 RepID=A0A1W7AB58_9STAP|nr:hypothetical protein [Macrococcus canis]ARQ06849.1 hypothetical protein MCCS_12030 [Macrococcus canis]